MERKPCPYHPERGSVAWFPVVQRNPATGAQQAGSLPACAACIAESKPATAMRHA